MDTEDERAGAKQAEAKEEALRSLPAHGAYTTLVLPAIAYNRNEHYWVGAVVPVLHANEKDELKNIYAPFYTHNQYAKETVGMYYYGYPSDTAQYSVSGSYSTRLQRDVDLTYKNVSAGGGQYILAGRVNWSKNPFRRLFGIGNRTTQHDETNYSSREPSSISPRASIPTTMWRSC